MNHAYATQWKPLEEWTNQNSAALYELLSSTTTTTTDSNNNNNNNDKNDEKTTASIKPKRILFGEWCVAKHSLHYTKLPSYFIVFDIWENGRFLSVADRDTLLSKVFFF